MILDDYREQVRRRWRRVTPFRLGIAVGEQAATPQAVANPYRTNYARRLFEQGVRVGVVQFRK